MVQIKNSNGWMVDGWMAGLKALLRIAFSYQKYEHLGLNFKKSDGRE